ncbi:unnamed protein product, partial [Ectocarpus sp. 12 AP-2014]
LHIVHHGKSILDISGLGTRLNGKRAADRQLRLQKIKSTSLSRPSYVRRMCLALRQCLRSPRLRDGDESSGRSGRQVPTLLLEPDDFNE